jgi:hypothetical protein
MNNSARRYSNIVDLPDDLKREVQKAVLWCSNRQRHAAPEAQATGQVVRLEALVKPAQGKCRAPHMNLDAIRAELACLTETQVEMLPST